MKKLVIIGLMMCTVISYSQKKEKNGTIYKEHPAINAVESMLEAFVAGDTAKIASHLADDFKVFNGANTNKDAKGGTKKNFLNRANWWKNNVDYLSIERSKGAYPDALEYKDDNQKDVVWVQTWDHVKGVQNKTGVKLDMPFHRMFVVNKDNKIQTMIEYYDDRVFREVNQSYVDRKNGVIFNHHDNINTVRRMVAASENNDSEKMFSFFDEKAYFRNVNMPDGEWVSLEEYKTNLKKFRENYDINSIDVVGYPDYLEYDLGDGKVVQSWWKFRLTRKSDKKKLVIPAMYLHDFNDEGKIIRSSGYYSAKLLEK